MGENYTVWQKKQFWGGGSGKLLSAKKTPKKSFKEKIKNSQGKIAKIYRK